METATNRCGFAARATDYGLDPALAEPALALFAEARRRADDEDVRARVDKASIAAYRLAIDPVWSVRSPSDVAPELLVRLKPRVATFLELCARFGVDRAAEHEAFAETRARLTALCGLAAE